MSGRESRIYAAADLLASQCIEALVNLTIGTGILNVALKDFRALVNPRHVAAVGVGFAEGKNSVRLAVQMALQGPLVAEKIRMASCVLVALNYSGDLFNVMAELEQIGQLFDPETAIIYNIFPGDFASLDDGCLATIILTGLDQ